MPKIRRRNLPPALLNHLLDRIKRREISSDHLGAPAEQADIRFAILTGVWTSAAIGVRPQLLIPLALGDSFGSPANPVINALFILSLKWMSSPTTARHGIWAGEAGMVLARLPRQISIHAKHRLLAGDSHTWDKYLFA